MLALRIVIIHFIFINFINPTEGLVELPPVEDNDIQVAEAVIRNTINTLFSILKFKGNKHNPKLKQYSTVHNYFVTLTLKDHNNLKEIAKLTRVDEKNIGNGTANFMSVLNEDNDENTETNNEIYRNEDNVIKYIVNFLSNLENLKEKYSRLENLDINTEILKLLQKDHGTQFNVTSDSDPNSLESLEDNSVLSENEFWQPSGRRVYRGDRTKIKHFPFMASIQIFRQFQCGGSIIKSDLVITAASCLQLAWNNRFFRENPAFLSVRVGSTFYYGGGEDISVLEIYFNPEYNPKNLRNNLSLLRLSRWLKFRKRGKKVKKISIDRNPSPLPMMTDGITIVGWGARSESNIVGDPWSNRLAFSVLDVYPLQDCQKIYSSEYVTKKNFCAGFLSKGSGACNRDVGGPGIIHGILAGVISFGSPVCGTPDAPTVFTKLGYYSNWIDKIMEQEVPHVQARTTLKQKFSFANPLSHTTEKPTTFKIVPIDASKIKPIPINAETALRFVEDNDLFKEFLATMFGSKETKDVQDIFNEEENDVAPNNDQPALKNIVRQPVIETIVKDLEVSKETFREPVTESVGFATKIYDFDYNNEVTKPNKFTLIDEQLIPENRESDRAIDDGGNPEEIVSTFVEKSVSSDSKEFKSLDIKNDERDNKRWNSIDDSVLTLLYVSDNETLNENNIVDDNEAEGISIDLDSFNDIFKSNNDHAELFDFLSKNEMYDVISEAINIETQNKDTERLWFLLFL